MFRRTVERSCIARYRGIVHDRSLRPPGDYRVLFDDDRYPASGCAVVKSSSGTARRMRTSSRGTGSPPAPSSPSSSSQDSESLKHRFPFHLLQRVVPYRNLELYDPDRLQVEPNVSPRLHAVMRYMLREYYAMVSSLDDQLGRLRAALDELHLTGDTVIIYTSDHGDLVGSHATERYRGKSLPYQNAYRVPLLVAGAYIPPVPSSTRWSAVSTCCRRSSIWRACRRRRSSRGAP